MNIILILYEFLRKSKPLTHSFEFRNKKIVERKLLLQVVKSFDVFPFFFFLLNHQSLVLARFGSGAKKAESRDRKFFG